MSVINQMLVDLERRRASGEERNRIPDHVRALPGESFSRQRPQVLVAAVLVTAAAMAGAWWWLMSGRATSAPTVRPEAVSAASTHQSAPAPAPLSPEAVENIAQRMSFELANFSESAAADRRVTPASPPREPVPAVRSRAAAPQATVHAAAPSSAPAKSPPQAATTAANPPRADIDKKVRELTPRQHAEGEYAKGAAALHEDRNADARAAFEAALQADASYHAARQALVGLLLNARRQNEASQVLQEGLAISPAQPGFAMALARLQVERGDLNAGVQTLARGLEFAANNADYIAFYAGLLQRQQKHAEAIEQFSRALGQRGNVGVWLLGLGISLDALGRDSDAQEAYRRAKASGNLSPDLQTFADQRLR